MNTLIKLANTCNPMNIQNSVETISQFIDSIQHHFNGVRS